MALSRPQPLWTPLPAEHTSHGEAASCLLAPLLLLPDCSLLAPGPRPRSLLRADASVLTLTFPVTCLLSGTPSLPHWAFLPLVFLELVSGA